MNRYPNEFLAEGSHGRCYELLAEAGLRDGVVLDLGCASGQLAEPIAALGQEYVGADIDLPALDELRSRGFEAHKLDLAVTDDELVSAVEAVLGGRPLAAVVMLDVLEHLLDPVATLRGLARLATSHEGLQLVVSIPNVTHIDVASKLLLGRWDVMDTGLLDDTHVRFFNERLVRETMARGGWTEVAVRDVAMPLSDQLFPVDSPALRPGAPLRQLLWRIRMAADRHGETYQFVRRYRPDPAAAATVIEQTNDRYEQDKVFLTVAVRASGTDATPLQRLLGDLARQGVDDVEALVGYARDEDLTLEPPDRMAGAVRLTRIPPDADWVDTAMATARGRYVALVDPRTRLSSAYVDSIRQAADALPGRVVQVGAVTDLDESDVEVAEVDGVIDELLTVELDPLDLVSSAPFGKVALDAHAIPRQAYVTAGLGHGINGGDAALTLLVIRAIELCGIVRSGIPVTVVHPSVLRDLASDVDYLQKHLSLTPLVAPEGAGSQILALRQAAISAQTERDDLATELAAIQDQVASLSWLLHDREAELAKRREARAWPQDTMRRVVRRLRRRVGSLARRR